MCDGGGGAGIGGLLGGEPTGPTHSSTWVRGRFKVEEDGARDRSHAERKARGELRDHAEEQSFCDRNGATESKGTGGLTFLVFWQPPKFGVVVHADIPSIYPIPLEGDSICSHYMVAAYANVLPHLYFPVA